MRRKLKLAILGAVGTQRRLARDLGMTENYISQLVQGWRDPTADERARIAAALGRSPRGLFLNDDDATDRASA